MIKCLECGLEAPRLQWTHFKFNCTGKFNNGKEYMQAHLGAQVVSEDLKKRCVVTLESLTKKYGEKEGKIKFESYRIKQSVSNSYEYKKEKYGWSQDDFDKYNASRAVTVENLVAKHGETKGLQIWEDYCEKQRITKSKDYVVAKYGIEYWNDLCQKKKSANSPAFIAQYNNITIEQAVEKLMARRSALPFSKLELEFVDELEKILGPLEHTNKRKPWGRWDTQEHCYYVYDIKHQTCIIEFNGDYWHANPKIYNEDDEIRGTKARDIWQKDKRKISLAHEAGYHTMVVWESDFMANKAQVIEEVVQWMLNTQK
jgi:very-short-patch-repair endonuclease